MLLGDPKRPDLGLAASRLGENGFLWMEATGSRACDWPPRALAQGQEREEEAGRGSRPRAASTEGDFLAFPHREWPWRLGDLGRAARLETDRPTVSCLVETPTGRPSAAGWCWKVLTSPALLSGSPTTPGAHLHPVPPGGTGGRSVLGGAAQPWKLPASCGQNQAVVLAQRRRKSEAGPLLC